MTRSRFKPAFLALLAAVAMAPPLAPSHADEGDPAGWSVSTDPRGRAFLKYATEAGGPRVLVIGCLRDVDEVFVSAKGVAGMVAGDDVELQLLVADAEWRISGSVARTEDGLMTFEKEMEVTAKARKALRKALMPVLTAPGPIVLQIGNSDTMELPLEPIAPRAGIAAAAKTFDKVCFGGK